MNQRSSIAEIVLLIAVVATCAAIAILVLWFTVFATLDADYSSDTTQVSVAVGEAIPTLILPHHDLVKAQRVELVEQHAKQHSPETIILVSPNHFDSGRGQIITTDKEWNIRGGDVTIQPARQLVRSIVDAGLVTDEEKAFTGEHGIANLLQELSDNYPEATIVPIVVRETASIEDVKGVTELLAQQCTSCMVVASIDMSHYQQAHVAEIHDRKTLRAFQEQDIQALQTVEIDSTRSAVFAAYWSRLHGMYRYELHAHTNSGYMVDDTSVETTTHLIGQYTTGEAVEAVEEVTFTVAGDTMFDRGVDEALSANGYAWLFEQFGDRVLWGTDVSWINVEGVVSANPIQAAKDSSAFIPLIFEERALGLLEYLHVTHAGFANNHAFDAGGEGLEYTRDALVARGIQPHGDPQIVSQQFSVERIQQGELTVSFIAAYVPGRIPALTTLIENERAGGARVIVLPHWGVEYQTTPSPLQQELAQEWVNAGASVIIGAHPHVVQPAQILTSEIGEQALVVYSLGNFIFDQQGSEATTTGLISTGVIAQDSLRLILSPLKTEQIQPVLQQYEGKQKILQTVCEPINGCDEGVIELQW